jgi:hypothetical protein
VIISPLVFPGFTLKWSSFLSTSVVTKKKKRVFVLIPDRNIFFHQFPDFGELAVQFRRWVLVLAGLEVEDVVNTDQLLRRHLDFRVDPRPTVAHLVVDGRKRRVYSRLLLPRFSKFFTSSLTLWQNKLVCLSIGLLL